MSTIELHPHPRARIGALRILAGVRDLATRPAPAGVDVIRLDVDLDMWFDQDGAERPHARINPASSVIARAFGVHGQMWGPVVFTGAADDHGVTTDLPVAAAVLLAGMAAACEPRSRHTRGTTTSPRPRTGAPRGAPSGRRRASPSTARHPAEATAATARPTPAARSWGRGSTSSRSP